MFKSTNPGKVFTTIVEELMRFLSYSFLVLFFFSIFLVWMVGATGKTIILSSILGYFVLWAWTVILSHIYVHALNKKITILNAAQAWSHNHPNDIVNATQTVYRYIHFIYIMRYFVSLICKKDTWERYQLMSKGLVEKMLRVLQKLASDLNTLIEENTSTIEAWINEIEAMSKNQENKNAKSVLLHRTRLENQIKQFEELQKVLIKL